MSVLRRLARAGRSDATAARLSTTPVFPPIVGDATSRHSAGPARPSAGALEPGGNRARGSGSLSGSRRRDVPLGAPTATDPGGAVARPRLPLTTLHDVEVPESRGGDGSGHAEDRAAGPTGSATIPPADADPTARVSPTLPTTATHGDLRAGIPADSATNHASSEPAATAAPARRRDPLGAHSTGGRTTDGAPTRHRRDPGPALATPQRRSEPPRPALDADVATGRDTRAEVTPRDAIEVRIGTIEIFESGLDGDGGAAGPMARPTTSSFADYAAVRSYDWGDRG